ncbi:Rho-binding antiterminator [Vibrio ishigakensis]|uniref:Rho-binding antiterminator n=1 Tax=Vibrio ishigakensis TaxID=1481914 RepID=UPI0021C361A9|nr:Rho-binding antiterminator [Vibrio ishigakensis]
MISCSQYDYIELICLYRYPIKLKLKSGSVVTGSAFDTARNQRGDESLKLMTDSGEMLVVLDDISTLIVTVDNPHVGFVSFE